MFYSHCNYPENHFPLATLRASIAMSSGISTECRFYKRRFAYVRRRFNRLLKSTMRICLPRDVLNTILKTEHISQSLGSERGRQHPFWGYTPSRDLESPSRLTGRTASCSDKAIPISSAAVIGEGKADVDAYLLKS